MFFLTYNCLAKIQKDCIFAPASPTRPAPIESPRVGTQQGYVVVAVRCRSLAILFPTRLGIFFLNFFYNHLPLWKIFYFKINTIVNLKTKIYGQVKISLN
tara:strand:- start:298132 stop:298431 length:300 start_codon:yes stop_codon:yes gene_type:complete